jgi:hypothetical protein
MEASMTARTNLALLGILALFQATPARAVDVETGVTPVCDTQKQAERLASLFGYSAQSAVQTVNVEVEDPRACSIANLAYLRGARLGVVRTPTGTYEIAEVLVVGLVSQDDIKPIKPAVYFSVLKIDERAV